MRVWSTEKILGIFRLSGTNVLLILAVVVGLLTSLGAQGFTALIRYSNHIFFGMTEQVLTHFAGGASIKWWLPAIPMLGGLLVGPIVFYFASEAKGHGVSEVMNAVARLGGIIRPRVAAAKTLASAICIGSGGSAGREGPIIQIGSAIGSTIGQVFRMSGERVRVLVGCGAAAGISSIFNAPIAGVIFSLEVILGDFAIRTFSPVLISSVVASIVTRSLVGDHPAFDVPGYSLVSAWEVPIYVVMGLLLGALAVFFTRALDYSESRFDALKMHPLLKPALGGLLLGVIAIFFPQVLADGYETIGFTLHGELALVLLLPLVFLKILATCFTLGSGNSGGVFAPSLFIGAVAGGAYGHLVNAAFPTVTATPGAYALVGMAGLVAGTTHAPMTALLIIFEMTGDYRIILPLMLTVAFAAMVARRMFPHSIYTVKLIKQGIDIRGGKDVNILRAHKVQEVMRTHFQTLHAATPLANILPAILQSEDTNFVVLDTDRKLVGVLSLQDIRAVISQPSLEQLVIAKDLVREDTETMLADDDLARAMNLLSIRDIRMLPVVDPGDKRRVIGVVRRDDLVDYYNRRLIEYMRQ